MTLEYFFFQPILDLHSWVVPLNVNAREMKLDYSEDELEDLGNIHFYKVKWSPVIAALVTGF